MDNHLFLPLLMPLVGAAIVTTLRHSSHLLRWMVALTTSMNLVYSVWLLGRTIPTTWESHVSLAFGSAEWLLWKMVPEGRQVTQVGDWQAPYGISLVADSLSAMVLCLASLLVFITVLFSLGSLTKEQEKGSFYPLLLLLLCGVGGVVISGDLFNLYIWFEVLLIASFGLLVLGGSRGQVDAGLNYMVLNLVGSITILIGCGLIYGVAGTLNMAHLSERFATCEQLGEMSQVCEQEIDRIFQRQTEPVQSTLINNCQEIQQQTEACTLDGTTTLPHPGLVTLLATIFLVAYGIRAAIAPAFFWVPGSLHTPPVEVTIILGGILTNVGAYTLYRIFTLIYHNEMLWLSPLLLLLAGLTMLIGVIGSIAQVHIRRILAFDLVTQTGFVMMGLGIAGVGFETNTPENGLAAGVLFLGHTMIVKTALFAIAAAIERLFNTGDVRRMGSLAKREPVLALLWIVASLALVGFPPLSGFFGKLTLLQSAMDQRLYPYAALMTVVTLLSLLPLLRIWNEVFWKPLPDHEPEPRRMPGGLLIPGAIMVLISLLVGMGASFAVDYTSIAAREALDMTGYVQDVLVTATGEQ